VRKNTPKRAAINRAADKWRKAQCIALSRCEYCGMKRDYTLLCVHELLKGNGLRRLAMDKPYATLVVCQIPCHALVDCEPIPRQLARLYLSDPGRLELVAFNRLRGRADNSITFADLNPHINCLLNSGLHR
jgi:hypothetical protein